LRIADVLTGLLIASAISLAIGGALLYGYRLVPNYLVELTGVAVLTLLVLSFFVHKPNMTAVNIGTVLGVIAPAFSLSTPAHVQVLQSFGSSVLISLLGLLQFLGFFLFPIAYVVLRLVYRNNIAGGQKQQQAVLGS
jgi:hypothetical protein